MIFQVTRAACVYHKFFSATEHELLDTEIDVFPGTVLNVIITVFPPFNLSKSFKISKTQQISSPKCNLVSVKVVTLKVQEQ